MTTENEWIATNERQPTIKDLPLWAFAYEKDKIYLFDHGTLPGGGFSHWKSANIPKPPPKAMSQRQRDEQSFEAWVAWPENMVRKGMTRHTWHAAVAKERAWFRTVIKAFEGYTYSPPEREALDKMRDRCREEGS